MTAAGFDAVIPSPLGMVGISASATAITSIDLLPSYTPILRPRTPLVREAVRQLDEYFAGCRCEFDLPLAEADTPFRRCVRKAMLEIPAGQTRSYGEIAADLGSSARAIGGACRTNPLPIVVPCHRVVGARGLGGYDGAVAGGLVDIKRRLLELEGARLPER